MSEIITRVDETVKKYNMLENGDFIVVGVSGGADSMLLLWYLLQKRKQYNLRLLVANVEHGIRGEESVNDTLFVKSFCEENGVEFAILSINAPDEARENSMGVEEYSRQRRYEFFSSFSPDKIATAHNLSDNVETFLFRCARGTSPRGLCSISPVRDNIIRPLIELSSDEIRAFCNDNSIDYRIDSTNAHSDYARNNIRNNIIPLFKQINFAFEKNVSSLIDMLFLDCDYLDSQAQQCFCDLVRNNAVDKQSLSLVHPAVATRVIVKLFEANSLRVDRLHVNQVYELLFKTGRQQIEGNFFAVADKNTIRIAKIEENSSLNVINVNKKVITKSEFLTNGELLLKQFAFYCDCDKINGNIYVRSRQEGDCISPAKRNCTKSLKKLFNELHIDAEKRASIPVLCDDNGIIGVYGCCVDERVRVSDGTNRVMLINILLEDKD